MKMTKRILILLFSVMLTGMSEDVDSDCLDGVGDYAPDSYSARGGEYGHGKKPPPLGVYVGGDTDDCTWMIDHVDQESEEEQY